MRTTLSAPSPRLRAGSLRPAVSALALAGLLGACAVGPDYKVAPVPPPGSLGQAARERSISAGVPEGGQQQLRAGAALAADWWRMFHSPQLDALVEKALQENPGLAAAQASLRQAQEFVRAGEGALWPSANLAAGVERQRASGAAFGSNAPGTSFNLYNAQVSVGYTFDLFGGVRRQLEALAAQADYSQEQLRAARLALAANLVTAVIRDGQLREQIEAQARIERLQRETLEIDQRRDALGALARSDLLSQTAAVAQTRAALAGLERQRDQIRHQIAALCGQSPDGLDVAALDAVRLELPADLPVSLPGDLVRQRPDVRAAEALVHSASAQLGVASANLFPQITLGAGVGSMALRPGDLFKPADAVWSVSAGLTQPLFHGGALRAQRRAAADALEAAQGSYRQTVLQALASVADTLQALDTDARALAAQSEAAHQSEEAAKLAASQYAAGAISPLALMSVQLQAQAATQALALARADRLADTAALYQALGGGWWQAAAPGNAAAAPVQGPESASAPARAIAP